MRIREIVDCDFRQLFKDNWVFESPLEQVGISAVVALNTIMADIESCYVAMDEKFPGFYHKLVDNFQKIITPTKVIYFQLTSDEKTLLFGVELEKHGQNYRVLLTAKSNSNPQFVSDIYLIILDDLDARILSDNKLTIGGFSIWKYLFLDGAYVGVYDITNVNNSYTRIKTIEELESYFGSNKNDPKISKSRFVLGNQTTMIEAWEQFAFRRSRANAICEDGKSLAYHDDMDLEG